MGDGSLRQGNTSRVEILRTVARDLLLSDTSRRSGSLDSYVFLDALAPLDFKLPVSQSVSQCFFFFRFSVIQVKQVTCNTHMTSNTSSTSNTFYANDARN